MCVCVCVCAVSHSIRAPQSVVDRLWDIKINKNILKQSVAEKSNGSGCNGEKKVEQKNSNIRY